MSAEATGWVWRHSPYKGTLLLVQLAIADVVNDAHGNEFWMTADALAEKTRSSRRSVAEALKTLKDAGWIEPIGRPRGGAVRYRCELPAHAMSKPRTSDVQDPHILSSTELKENSKELSRAFDEFWKIYPRNDDKVKARTAFKGALKLTDAETIIAGAKRYHLDPNRDPKFTKLPATWLHAGSWDNGPLPSRESSNGQGDDSARWAYPEVTV